MGVGKRERQTDRERRDRIQVIIFGKPIYLFINEGTLKISCTNINIAFHKDYYV